MKAIVCVKQVPDTSGKVAVNPDGTLNRASMPTISNPDDRNALEAALQLKDATGCSVVVITMGPPPAESMLREMLAMGADEAVLVSAREFGGSDTFATSQILAAAIHKLGLEPGDVVLCGRQAIDGDTAQVGPQIAEKLDIPQISYVADVALEGERVVCRRMLEDGYMTIETETPCLLTCIKELNQPRYMSMRGIYSAYEKPMQVMDFNALKDEALIDRDTIGLQGSPTNNPLGLFSDEHRETITNYLPHFGKQIIFMVSSGDLTDKYRQIIAPYVKTEYYLDNTGDSTWPKTMIAHKEVY